MSIETLVSDLSHDPFNAELNFKCALEYERLGQTASAVSFYLRTAEYGETLLTYTALLKVAKCLDGQNDRMHTVSNTLLQAVALCSDRPEAYFLLSNFHERAGHWQECYTWAELGLGWSFCDPLPADVGYYAPYCLEFEKAIAAWWIGRKDESLSELRRLYQLDYITDEYKQAIKNNLDRLD